MPAVPVTKATWTNNVDALSSTNLHAYLRDPLAFVMAPPRAELRQTVAQSGMASGSWIALTFTSETVDTDVDGIGGHSTSVNTSRYVARYPGWYQVNGAYAPEANTTGRRGTRWAVNGSALDASTIIIPAGTASGVVIPSRTKQIFLDEGDFVELQAFQDSGGTRTTVVTTDAQSGMSVRWVSLT